MLNSVLLFYCCNVLSVFKLMVFVIKLVNKMLKLSVVLFLLCISTCNGRLFKTLDPVKSYTAQSDQLAAVQDLVKRVLGDRSDEIKISLVPEANYQDFALLQYNDGILTITGNNGIGIAYGLNHYLKYFCRKQLSWAGDQIGNIPKPLPAIPTEGLFLQAGVKYRYYQNVCTVSYSSVWWNWTRWEREIDWMALNGINLPLAFTGQEAIWQRVYKKLGLSQMDLDEHFVGPAFLAWGRMGNLKGFGGPLPDSWKESQLALQHKILNRMRSLGMIPVLPGFAGHVPLAVSKKYPNASISQLGGWANFNCTYSCSSLLEPDDPLFRTIGKMFIEEQIKEYNGTNHIYNADTFNEMIPRSNNVSYLGNASLAVYEAMTAGDPQAVWLMQGWLFHNAPWFWQTPQIKALVTAVPMGRLLLLDLFSEAYPQFERANYYYGQPFIWCMLHDFGGNLGFYGKLEAINNNPRKTLLTVDSTMVGTGITPEGINQNYLVYDLMLEAGFTVQPVNISLWIEEYVRRRYDSDDKFAIATWLEIGSSIYNDTTTGFPAKSLIRGPIVKRPSTVITELPYWYTYSSLESVWDYFSKAMPNLKDIPTVRYDAVDITRQMLQAIHRVLYYAMLQEFEWKNPNTMFTLGELILDLYDDFDRILATDSHFMMGCWIRDARLSAVDPKDRDLFEYNARNQVTLWGPEGEILDYGDKHWASLAKYYYRPRWALFIQRLEYSLITDTPFDPVGFAHDVFSNVEEPFTISKSTYPTTPTENSLEVAMELYHKWRPFLTL